MANYLLRLFEDRLAPASEAPLLRPCNRMLYCAEGRFSVGADWIDANEARHAADGIRLRAGKEGARILRYELVPAQSGDSGHLTAEEATSRQLLAEAIALDRLDDHLMRCDRVDFPPGGIAYLHTHQGPGIRCLVQGRIRVETEGNILDRDPFEAWFEGGPEPVLARASEEAETAFVRVMILPAALLGESSISYVRAEDRDKPKSQRYTVFQDQLITL